MPIHSFTYRDHVTGWELQEVKFQQFNLLVGLSSAGKTRILSALRDVCLFGRGNGPSFNVDGADRAVHTSWVLRLEVDEVIWEWAVELKKNSGSGDLVGEGNASAEARGPRVLMERLVNTQSGKVVLERTPESFTFEGSALPMTLNGEASALNLIENDESVRAVRGLLRKVKTSESVQLDNFAEGFPFRAVFHVEKRIRDVGFSSFDELRRFGRASLLAKAHMMQSSFAEEFARVQGAFEEMFPNVQQVRIGHPKEFGRSGRFYEDENTVVVAVKENCMKGWAVGDEISSGMLRTLFHLLELALLSPGSVIIKDQYEDGLGINCLGVLTEMMLKNDGGVQFILTSHHPYVINNIPRTDWKIVTRKGALVSVVDASDVPALSSRSAQPAFSLLVNSDWFQESVQ